MRTRQGRRVSATVITGASVLLALFPGSTGAQEPAPELLPDLQGQVARDVMVEIGAGVRNLRLTTTVANGGLGALEIFPVPATDCDGDGDAANDRFAFQRVFRDTDGSRFFDRAVDIASTAYPAGCMVYHPAHDHWHFEDFASYELLIPGTDAVVASATKVSFCVVDSSPFDLSLIGHPTDPYYATCSEDGTEGISVGWGDTYASSLPGQAIDIRGVPDGQYCLAVSGDPSDILRESDELNNDAVRPITLARDTVAAADGVCDASLRQSQDSRIRSAALRKCRKLKSTKRRRKCRRRS